MPKVTAHSTKPIITLERITDDDTGMYANDSFDYGIHGDLGELIGSEGERKELIGLMQSLIKQIEQAQLKEPKPFKIDPNRNILKEMVDSCGLDWDKLGLPRVKACVEELMVLGHTDLAKIVAKVASEAPGDIRSLCRVHNCTITKISDDKYLLKGASDPAKLKQDLIFWSYHPEITDKGVLVTIRKQMDTWREGPKPWK